MATSTGFKQQCPSCEALVPIKDVSLIGRKIDCPKCKYRFVVEEPEDKRADDSDDGAPAGKKGIKKSGPAPAAKGKAADAKTKPGARRRRDDAVEDEGEDQPAKKKAAGGSNMTMGLVLAGVGVVVLGVAAFFIFRRKDDPPKTTTPPGNNTNNNAAEAPKDHSKDKKVDDGAAGNNGPGAGAKFTKLLLNHTHPVTHFDLKKIPAPRLA